MSVWKKSLQNFAEWIDDSWDEVRYRISEFGDPDEDIFIFPYLGFGSRSKIVLRGRVLEKKEETLAQENDNRFRNLVRTIRLFKTDEVPRARLKAAFGDLEAEIEADLEGFFDIEMETGASLGDGAFHELDLELLKPALETPPTAKGQILIPPATAKFGVISDIDDTVIKTDVNNRLQLLAATFLTNEHTRLPFEGVAEFYRALRDGRGGGENNPIFYISSSPWNFYALLNAIFVKRDIPLGPIFLKDFGTHTPFTANDHQTHKLENIRRVLNIYPDLPFILIGDDGEQDPYIYRQIVKEFPNKIKVIYIRKVKKLVDDEEVLNLIREVRESGSQLLYMTDSDSAAVHAASENLIAAKSVTQVSVEKALDEQSPPAEALVENNPA
jgi:phosphatidate phosphatase APP1